MSLDIEAFAAEPSAKVLSTLKWAELTRVAEHYHITIGSGARKGEIRQAILSYLREEELISDKEGEETSNTALRRLELEERAKEREAE